MEARFLSLTRPPAAAEVHRAAAGLPPPARGFEYEERVKTDPGYE
jgi:hypothetical protein